MAGAAIIAAVTNALEGREFPFVFGGDGASFAVGPDDFGRAREALAATAVWVREDLDLVMRVALVPIAAIRAQNLDVRVARFAPSPNVSYAMFSGGGLGWAETAMKRGEFAVPAAPPGTQPDLTGLSCRFEEMPSMRGLILSVLVVPAKGAEPFSLSRGHRRSHCDGGAYSGSRTSDPFGWSRDQVAAGGDGLRSARRAWRIAAASSHPGTCEYVCGVCRDAVRHQLGNFVPKVYVQEVVENSDFRKYDDGLRMILDCTEVLAQALEQRLAAAASAGVVRYGLHRQDAAMMTCFTPTQTARIMFTSSTARGAAMPRRRRP